MFGVPLEGIVGGCCLGAIFGSSGSVVGVWRGATAAATGVADEGADLALEGREKEDQFGLLFGRE